MAKLINKYRKMPVTVKVSVAYAVCSILQRCLSFITLPLFTRILTNEEYGQYSVYASWSAILTIFITLNLAYGSFSTAMIKFEDRRSEYISAIQGISLCLGIVFLAIYLPFNVLWNKLFKLPTALMILMVVENIANMAIACWSGKKRFEFKYKAVVAITLGVSVVSPVLAYILIKNSEEKGFARIVGYAAVTICVGLIIFIINLHKGKKLYNKEFWKYALGFNVPLIIYYLSQVIFNQSDRIMIDHMCGTDKAGIYSVAYSLAIILTFVLNAINNSYQPWFYEKIKDNKEYENKNASNGIALLMAVLLMIVIMLAPEIIYVMAGKQYMEAVWIVPPVAGSILLLLYSQYSINVEFYFERKRELVYASVSSALVNIILNWFLIPVFGYIVAGYTTWISYILFVIMNYIAMKKILIEKGLKQNMYDLKFLIYLFAIFSAFSFLAIVLYNYMIARFIVMLAGLLLVFVFRKKVFYFVDYLVKK